ncbi:MAG: hydantoinase/oxoprolinase family protein [Eubacteriales bacterium]|nr:hydantoinase/oxoprolinase family protein [Eubacteriales bacterium]
MKLAIGIDTGGTCTDAVLYDFDTGKIVCHNKALTTYDDLTRGILAALDGLDPTLCRQATVAGLSTTLSTNACVEGKFRRPRLLLLGIDRKGIARFGANYGFTDPDDIRYLPCKTTITGEVQVEPDWNILRSHAKEWFSDVESCAVCEIYGMRNDGILEKKAAQILREETALPVICASELFSGMSSLERAASAVLNAGLLPLTQNFLEAVTKAFRDRDIHAEIYLVRSDSSLMGMQYSAEHAVETLLSGPAASALGGSCLAKQSSAVIVDMGGTTTDVAIIENDAPLLSDDGIRVGQWKTLVKGLFATSFALGGDSAVRWDKHGNLSLGPDRVIPLCVLAERYPQILPVLEKQVFHVPSHTLPLHEFLTLNRTDWKTLSLSEEERALCAYLENGPLSVQQTADTLGIDKYNLHTETLERAGVILRSGLTPTDIMHIRGDYTQYTRQASIYAARFAAQSLNMDLEQLCHEIYTQVSRKIFFSVSKMLLEHASPYYRKNGFDNGMEQLLALQWDNRHTGGSSLLQYTFCSTAVLVGIGGPIHLFLPEAAKALGAEYIIPECAAVANAVGAVTGQMISSKSAEIRPHGLSAEDETKGDYEAIYGGQTVVFTEEQDAVTWLTEQMKRDTEADLRARGAVGALSFRVKLDDITAPAYSGYIKIASRVTVTAQTNLTLTNEE